jgi:hypothetical protein
MKQTLLTLLETLDRTGSTLDVRQALVEMIDQVKDETDEAWNELSTIRGSGPHIGQAVRR